MKTSSSFISVKRRTASVWENCIFCFCYIFNYQLFHTPRAHVGSVGQTKFHPKIPRRNRKK